MQTPLTELLEGPFHFSEIGEESLAPLMVACAEALPSPYPIFLEDETLTPYRGYPVLLSESWKALGEALESYLTAEEEAQLAAIQRQPFSRTRHAAAWDRYRGLLRRAVYRSILASYGSSVFNIFWLYHSRDVARHLRETPRRLLRVDSSLGRRHGAGVKYRVFEKYRDQVRQAVFEVVRQITDEHEEVEQEGLLDFFSRLFANALIFTEEQIGPDLAELGPYFEGHLGMDAQEFRQRFERLVEWHDRRLEKDRELRALALHVCGVAPEAAGRPLLNRPGYVTYLLERKGYSASSLLRPEEAAVWEELLPRLKDFEIFAALRHLVLPVRREDGSLVFRAGGLDRTWVGQRLLRLSTATRPMDFLAPAVIDPLVHRYGMVYDISDFAAVVSQLRRAGTDRQDHAFRMMLRFQRRINRMAASYRLQLEKYMGDGAFFTSREPWRILVCAVHLQRLYRRALEEGLPFDRGMRIGLNFGHYRLIPIQRTAAGGADRYEFFGHGVVELSRLTSGKGRQEVKEIQSVLLSYGYPASAVETFFAPLSQHNLDLIDQREESRPFYAYINRSGSLINEGIVATEEFIHQLAESLENPALYTGTQGERRYLVLALRDKEVGRAYLGLRKLGMAHLKGLEELSVVEVLDGADLGDQSLEPVQGMGILEALDHLCVPNSAPGPVARRAEGS